ncbi:hypothetical protein PanWU01x14_183090 [Parasponia andersonii]|uniref:Uncharacterized protein n=1 Tax=Parasponia andersonii TaxID=3476 RepID=A0A2P5C4T6_PARAD|nr:hypothetical protein PanWU01x14_183090 [Parasponia andersonii]
MVFVLLHNVVSFAVRAGDLFERVVGLSRDGAVAHGVSGLGARFSRRKVDMVLIGLGANGGRNL